MQARSSSLILVRQRDSGDDGFIARLGSEAFLEFSSEAREHTLGMARSLTTLVAVREKQRLGIAILERFSEHVELQAIAVIESERGRGIGYELLLAVERYARAHQARRIGLRTAEANLAAIDLFRRHGFRVERRLLRYYRRVFDAFVMVKVL